VSLQLDLEIMTQMYEMFETRVRHIRLEGSDREAKAVVYQGQEAMMFDLHQLGRSRSDLQDVKPRPISAAQGLGNTNLQERCQNLQPIHSGQRKAAALLTMGPAQELMRLMKWNVCVQQPPPGHSVQNARIDLKPHQGQAPTSHRSVNP
jgi:hypothetical protein